MNSVSATQNNVSTARTATWLTTVRADKKLFRPNCYITYRAKPVCRWSHCTCQLHRIYLSLSGALTWTYEKRSANTHCVCYCNRLKALTGELMALSLGMRSKWRSQWPRRFIPRKPSTPIDPTHSIQLGRLQPEKTLCGSLLSYISS